jgi:hypothetical protein
VNARSSYEYAIVRVVPHVEREEFINAGVILHCHARDYLAAAIELDAERLRALAPAVDEELVRWHLAAIPRVCAGGPEAGPIGKLSRRERFHWLIAPRSTMIQTSPGHAGLCDAPAAAIARLLERMVRPPQWAGPLRRP